MTFAEARALFPVLERLAYLNTGSFGPLSRPTLDAIAEEQRRAGAEGRAGLDYYERMLALRTRVRGLLAAQVGVDAHYVALTDSTTTGCNIVLAGLDLGAGDEIVTTDTEHLGLLGPALASGADVRVAAIADATGEAALERLLAEVTPRTRLIAVSHVSWVTGHALDVAMLKREAGLPVLVDGAQAVGAIPVEATELDFYTISGQKWLCGPDSTGALFVADPDALRVARPSYFAAAKHEIGVPAYEPKPEAARFDSGWIPTPSLAGLAVCLADLPEWRFERAAATAARCRDLLLDHVEIITEPGHGTLVSFRASEDAASLSKRLYEAGVVVRDLPGTGLVRASCGWWTSDDDLDRLVDALTA